MRQALEITARGLARAVFRQVKDSRVALVEGPSSLGSSLLLPNVSASP